MKDPVAVITLSIAILGAALGVLNFWRSVVRDSYRVKVIPKFWTSEASNGICIEVINLGNFDITIIEVGIQLRNDTRLAVHSCYTNTKRLPERLEARTSLTVYAAPGTEDDPRLAGGLYAYAKTSCGKRFKGRSGFLKQAIRKAGTA